MKPKLYIMFLNLVRFVCVIWVVILTVLVYISVPWMPAALNWVVWNAVPAAVMLAMVFLFVSFWIARLNDTYGTERTNVRLSWLNGDNAAGCIGWLIVICCLSLVIGGAI